MEKKKGHNMCWSVKTPSYCHENGVALMPESGSVLGATVRHRLEGLFTRSFAVYALLKLHG